MSRPPSPPPLFPRTVTFDTSAAGNDAYGLGFTLEVAGKLDHLPMSGTAPSYGPLASRFVQPTGLVVIWIERGCPAAAAGLMVGDRVAQVNGRHVSGLCPPQVGQIITAQQSTDLVVLHDPQLATALVLCVKSGVDPRTMGPLEKTETRTVTSPTQPQPPPPPPPTANSPTPTTPSPTSTALPSLPRQSSPTLESTQVPLPTTSPPPPPPPSSPPPSLPSTSSSAAVAAPSHSTTATPPFAWKREGLTPDQLSSALAKRREELLALDLTADPALQCEWQSLISARDAFLMREFRSTSEPPRRAVPRGPPPSRRPGAAATAPDDEFDEYSDKLVAENAALNVRVKELWAVVGLFKADKLADKLIEQKGKLDAARAAISAEGVGSVREDLAEAIEQIDDLEATVAEQSEALEETNDQNDTLRAKLVQLKTRALEKFAEMQSELDLKDNHIAQLKEELAQSQTRTESTLPTLPTPGTTTIPHLVGTVRVLPPAAATPAGAGVAQEDDCEAIETTPPLADDDSVRRAVRPKADLPAWLSSPSSPPTSTTTDAVQHATAPVPPAAKPTLTRPKPGLASKPSIVHTPSPSVTVARPLPANKPIASSKPILEAQAAPPIIPASPPVMENPTPPASKPTTTTPSSAAAGVFRITKTRMASHSDDENEEADDDEWGSDAEEAVAPAPVAAKSTPSNTALTASTSVKSFPAAARRAPSQSDTENDDNGDDDWGDDSEPDSKTAVTDHVAPTVATSASPSPPPPKSTAAAAIETPAGATDAAARIFRAAAGRAAVDSDGDAHTDDDEWDDDEEDEAPPKPNAAPSKAAEVTKPPVTVVVKASPLVKPAVPTQAKSSPVTAAGPSTAKAPPLVKSQTTIPFEFPVDFMTKMAKMEQAELETALEEWQEMYPDEDPETSEDWAAEKEEVQAEFEKYVVGPARDEFRKAHASLPPPAAAGPRITRVKSPAPPPAPKSQSAVNGERRHGSSSEVNEIEARITHEIGILIECLHRIGTVESDGRPRASFGQIFVDEVLEQELESLVGTLRAAKKRKILDFPGAILLQGAHDDVVITLLQ